MTRPGRRGATTLRERLLALGAVPGAPLAFGQVKLMHATAAAALPAGAAWLYELKFDGYRVLAGRAGGRAHLHYRRGSEGTATWPELAAALARLPVERLILDAELVVSEGGRPKFALVQERFGITRPSAAHAAAQAHPAHLLVFDLLAYEDVDLRGLPLEERKAALTEVLDGADPALQFVDHVAGAREGAELYRRSRELGGEGVIAKRIRSRYQPGRSREWLKVRQNPTFDFVVVGYSLPGDRVGALHLAGFHAGGELVYVGTVKSGFPRGFLEGADTLLRTIARADPPCRGVAVDVAATWVEPRVVVEVGFAEVTPTGVLRHAEFVRLRPDKAPPECVLASGFGAGVEGRPVHHRRSRW